eukprot:356868-Chlamydomonas_euryale.AAC.16
MIQRHTYACFCDAQLTMRKVPTAVGEQNAELSGEAHVCFPYCVLELKLEQEDTCPPWILVCQKTGGIGPQHACRIKMELG